MDKRNVPRAKKPKRRHHKLAKAQQKKLVLIDDSGWPFPWVKGGKLFQYIDHVGPGDVFKTDYEENCD